MKTKIFLFIGALILSYTFSIGIAAAGETESTQAGSINIVTSPDLYYLTTKWANEYHRINPKVQFSVIKSADNDLAGMLNKSGGIGFISGDSFTALNNVSTWAITVGRDVIVPVMNVRNPCLDEILRKGITSGGLVRILENTGIPTWGMLLNNGQNFPLHIYLTNDPSIKAGIGNFLHIDKIRMESMGTTDRQEMIAMMCKDQNALGFCKLTDLGDLNKQHMNETIRIVPIDKNGNGKIDFMEDIYENLQEFSRGVWIGKYPKALSGSIYCVASVKPTNGTEMAFLQWLLTDGQQYLNMNGFSDLVYNERQTQLDKMKNNTINVTAAEKDPYANLKVIGLVLAALAVLGFTLDLISRKFRKKNREGQDATVPYPTVFDEESVVVPKGLYFDKTHTWAFMEPDGTVKIGIDDFLQHITGPLTHIEMKKTGEKIKKGDHLLTMIQKGKQLNIYAPLSGTVTAQNKTLIGNSFALNTAHYTDRWICKIEPVNWLREVQFLTMAEKYKIWLKDEFIRLKDFFTVAIKTNSPEYANVTLQDGGALKDSILADLGPEVWEDFQTKFIDNTR